MSVCRHAPTTPPLSTLLPPRSRFLSFSKGYQSPSREHPFPFTDNLLIHIISSSSAMRSFISLPLISCVFFSGFLFLIWRLRVLNLLYQLEISLYLAFLFSDALTREGSPSFPLILFNPDTFLLLASCSLAFF